MVNFKFELIAAKQTFRFYVLKNCANEKKKIAKTLIFLNLNVNSNVTSPFKGVCQARGWRNLLQTHEITYLTNSINFIKDYDM